MLSFDSVKLRLDREQSLSFLEFNYMILQAYDFVELNQRYGVTLQMGGSDQWGNIVNGIELGHRMGSTAALRADDAAAHHSRRAPRWARRPNGAVWLNADMLRPLRVLAVLAQHRGWRRRSASSSSSPACPWTRSPASALGGSDINEAKKILATEVTALAHGRAAAEEAAETARRTFEEGALAENLPTIEVAASDFAGGLGILSLFVQAGLVASNGEARRQIKGGGLRVNDQAVTDEKMMLTPALLTEGVIKLSLGKKRHILLKPA
jgi:tyrosyl-tRNA synthetase